MSHQHQCVPTWDFDDVVPVPQVLPPAQAPAPQLPGALNSRSYHSAAPDTSMLDYEMAELTWENGHLTMHGLGPPRVADKPSIGGAWIDKPSTRASGTLESVINQGYSQKPAPPVAPGGACDHDGAWFGPTDPAASVPVTTDALVPNNGTHNGDQGVGRCVVRSSTRVGSCSTTAARVPGGSDWSVSMSASESTRRQRLKRPAEDTCEQLRSMNNGFTSTSCGASPENTKTCTVDEYDSACHSSPPKERREEEKNRKQGTNKSTLSTKRSNSRAAAIHNQSERKRRDKINQRMKTLQKLVPNSNKTDKASMLDEVIDYLKQLQAQVQMLSKMSMPMPSMMMPLAIQQQLQMSMLAPMGMGMGMGLGMGMGMEHMNMSFNPMGRPNITGIPPAVFNPTAYSMPLSSSNGTPLAGGDHCLSPADHLSAYLACHSHPMTIDAYTRMAAMYQQLQQQQQCQHQHQHQQPGPSSNT